MRGMARSRLLLGHTILLALLGILGLAGCGDETTVPPGALPPTGLPAFLCTVRGYGGGGHDDDQLRILKDLGVTYVHGVPDFYWGSLESTGDVMKWALSDSLMDRMAVYGLKTIPLVLCPKSAGLPWDSTVTRDQPEFRAEYEEFTYELVRRYHTHPAWSGIVAGWGGSSDVFTEAILYHQPEVIVPLQNAVYAGAKRGDPATIVVSFNMATTASSAEQWEEWHERAFQLGPKMDWFGVQSHGVWSTRLEAPGAYSGAVGLTNVRRFLDERACGGIPIFLNEGGFEIGIGEDVHAEQVVETYVVGRSIEVDLTGWVYFALFGKEADSDEGRYGLMTSLDESDPPQPRKAYVALQVLIRTVGFFEYDFEARLAGEINDPDPFVLQFARRDRPSSKLWVVFSPRISHDGPVLLDVGIPISPAVSASVIDMLGEHRFVAADSTGKVFVTSSSEPTYLKAEGVETR